MADQPQPDFSQNQQFAPGFQPQMPIPGISSSYNNPNYGYQYQQNQQQYNNPTQQSDQIAVQNVIQSQNTMAIVQQNLMNSMHTAMLGSMNAFSDVTRRSASMVSAIVPQGTRYNDLLAPNQNWALESSFKREMGYMAFNGMGVDPYQSTWSKLIQGRRPEFMTEGEYGSAMGYATQLRVANLEKVGIGLSGGLATSAAANVLYGTAYGLGGAASLAVGGVAAVAGLGIQRMAEAEFAEKEEIIRQKMTSRFKRVGIGQQWISDDTAGRVTQEFYGQENPYWARFFGNNAVGNAFRPDVQKLKIFDQVKDNGLMSFENLDPDAVIGYVNKLSSTIEKFSRIAKVTREQSIKIMADIKSTGIHGDELLETFKSSAVQSSLTGLDIREVSGMKNNAALQARQFGFQSYAASENMGNLLTGFAMMQQNGAFRGQDAREMAATSFNFGMQNARPSGGLGNILANGGPQESIDKWREEGGGNVGLGRLRDEFKQKNPGNGRKDMIKGVEWMRSKKMDITTMTAIIAGVTKGDPRLQQQYLDIMYGNDTDESSDLNTLYAAYQRTHNPNDLNSGDLSISESHMYANLSTQELRIFNAFDKGSLREFDKETNRGAKLELGKNPWDDLKKFGRYLHSKTGGADAYNSSTQENKIAFDRVGGSEEEIRKNRQERMEILKTMKEKMQGLVKPFLNKEGKFDEKDLGEIADKFSKEFGVDSKTFKNNLYNKVLTGSGLDKDDANKLAFGLLREQTKGGYDQISKRVVGIGKSGILASRIEEWKKYGIKFDDKNDDGVDKFLTFMSKNGRTDDLINAINDSKGDDLEDLGANVLNKLNLTSDELKEWNNSIDSSDKFTNMVGKLQKNYENKESGKTGRMLGYLQRHGYDTTKSEEMARYKRDLNPIENFYDKYYDQDGNLKNKNATNKDKIDMAKDLNTLLRNENTNVQSLLKDYIKPGKNGYEALLSMTSDGTPLDDNQISRIGQGRKGIGLALPDKTILENQAREIQKAGEKDSSDETIKTLNTLLGKVIDSMGGKIPEAKTGFGVKPIQMAQGHVSK
jgi:hypothetical protein